MIDGAVMLVFSALRRVEFSGLVSPHLTLRSALSPLGETAPLTRATVGSNPIVLSQIGVSITADRYSLHVGPYDSPSV